MWVRGLKLRATTGVDNLAGVAPHVGAWIETSKDFIIQDLLLVAPHVGAWIETWTSTLQPPPPTSHPMWVRGLKQNGEFGFKSQFAVAPHVGAWIET